MRGSQLSHLTDHQVPHPNEAYMPTPECKHEIPAVEERKMKTREFKKKIKSFNKEAADEEPMSPSKIPAAKISLSEIIKNRGRVIDLKRKNANFNDLVDERYESERRDTRKNLIELEALIKQ